MDNTTYLLSGEVAPSTYSPLTYDSILILMVPFLIFFVLTVWLVALKSKNYKKEVKDKEL